MTNNSSHSFVLEVSSDSQFKNKVSLTSLDAKKLRSLSDGKYFWRVKQMSSLGNESLWSSVSEFSLAPAVRKIELIRPRERKKIASFDIRFSWREDELCETYELSISRTVDFDNVIVREETDDASYTLELDDESEYHWFVSCLTKLERKLFSPIRSFEIDFSNEGD